VANKILSEIYFEFGSIMKLWQKILLAAMLLSTLGFTIFSWWIGYAFDDICGNSLISEISSPNKQMKAVIYERDCGALVVQKSREHLAIGEY
jgi:hypothetical protein